MKRGEGYRTLGEGVKRGEGYRTLGEGVKRGEGYRTLGEGHAGGFCDRSHHPILFEREREREVSGIPNPSLSRHVVETYRVITRRRFKAKLSRDVRAKESI